MLLIILLHALYGCTFTISKILIKLASPILVIGIRMTIAGILLSAFSALFIRQKEHDGLFKDKVALWYIFQIAVFGTFLPYVLRYWALQFLPVTKTALIYNISPFVSFFFSYLFFNEKSSVRKWIGLAFGFCGVLPILITKSSAVEASIGGIGFLSYAEIAMLVAVTCFSYGWIVMKKLVLHCDMSPAQINGSNMFIAGILALMTSVWLEPVHTIVEPKQFAFWLGLIIIITNFFCYNLYAILLRKYSATLLSLAGLIAPVSAAITSWLYFGERIGGKTTLPGSW